MQKAIGPPSATLNSDRPRADDKWLMNLQIMAITSAKSRRELKRGRDGRTGMQIRPFKCYFSDEEIRALQNELAATRWGPRLAPEVGDGVLGIDRRFLERLLYRWAHGFEWRQ